jgi:hypothetical protein
VAQERIDGIVAFSQTDFMEDLKKITAPVLAMHDDDDLRRFHATFGKVSEEWHVENLQRFPAWYADDGS